ncbi:MAG: hypothetical protein Q9202_002400 [Teloschistes flavicans]
MAPTVSFNDLPAEVGQKIVSFLAWEEPTALDGPPAEPGLTEEPSVRLLNRETKNIKNFSLVSHYARALALQILLTYLQIEMDLTPVKGRVTKGNADPYLRGLKGVLTLVQQHNLIGKIHALTLYFSLGSRLDQHYLTDFKFKAIKMIAQLNPLALTIMGPPSLLGNLLDLNVETKDEWAFGPRLQVVRLKQDYHRSRTEKSAIWERPTSLWYSRPWIEASFNEGSSLSAYSTYAYHSMTTPSVLHCLYGRQWFGFDMPAVLPFLRHFEFVAIFPLWDHIVEVMNAIRSLPHLVSLTTQITPSTTAKDNILEDPERVGKAELSDLWAETDASYRYMAQWIWEAYYDEWSLRRWTSPDKTANVDGIRGSVLGGDWELIEPGVWERRTTNDLDAEQ